MSVENDFEFELEEELEEEVEESIWHKIGMIEPTIVIVNLYEPSVLSWPAILMV